MKATPEKYATLSFEISIGHSKTILAILPHGHLEYIKFLKSINEMCLYPQLSLSTKVHTSDEDVSNTCSTNKSTFE